ncbi:tungstate transport system ATP-binding protein [Albidovulum inexpectatum]|uniref:Tungstate transport system ATP-binding protein n=1 Tax=Albidovulum inexpectatum TaxID=196587 RepID=A0A2S5JGE6_9RHOB|nr:ATP-binding cassette domain-containing protein [Albidovulum inexpectatum]PPB80500.1 tungstate transport system ATP-binding protein [Albidovulum inexpectatum]
MVTNLLPLRITDLELRRAGRRILGPISLTLEGRGITVVLGPNGSGKTSLLRAMHGLERLSAGRIDWACGEAVARARQAFVFQTPILMRRSVLDCIAYPLVLDGVGRRAARAAARAMADSVGLTGVALDAPASVLSGGERQKMALARALIRQPQILFLDEPCANLDNASTREIETVLLRESARGVRIVMSTHNVGQARRLADEIVFLFAGRLHEAAPAREFFAGPATPEARAHIAGDLPT